MYALLGLAVAALFLLWIRYHERRWISGATFFLAVFYVHGFVDPAIRLGLGDPIFSEEGMALVYPYTVMALLSIAAGYFCATAVRGRQPLAGVCFDRPLLNWTAARMTFVLVAILGGLLFLAVFASGALHEGKGAGAYGGGGVLRQLGAVSMAAIPFLLALFESAFCYSKGRKAATLGFVFCVFVLFSVFSFVSFERLTIMTLAAMFGLFYFVRVRSIGPGRASMVLLFVFLVTAASTGRRYGAGIAELGLSDILSLFSDFASSPLTPILALGAAVPGQGVFSQVVMLVPDKHGFMYGSTYLDSLSGVLAPRFITGDYGAIDTPAYWFKSVYAPDVEGHGYGFSALAEAYLNFGQFMFVAMFALGVLVSILSRWINSSSSQLKVLVGIISIVAISFGLRSDSNVIIKKTVFYVVAVLVVLLVEKFLRAAARPER